MNQVQPVVSVFGKKIPSDDSTRISEEKAVATCLSFATSNTIRKQFYHYLLPNGYIERVSRGVYKIAEKGEKLLEILN